MECEGLRLSHADRGARYPDVFGNLSARKRHVHRRASGGHLIENGTGLDVAVHSVVARAGGFHMYVQ
jgi:hypothetical protein